MEPDIRHPKLQAVAVLSLGCLGDHFRACGPGERKSSWTKAKAPGNVQGLVVNLKTGGESGIRTHDTVARIPVFETGAFVRSAISPQLPSISQAALRFKVTVAPTPPGRGLKETLPPLCRVARIRSPDARITTMGRGISLARSMDSRYSEEQFGLTCKYPVVTPFTTTRPSALEYLC